MFQTVTTKAMLPWIVFLFLFTHSLKAQAEDLKPGDQAPLFVATLQDGKSFHLNSRKGKWTVLYFYPRDNTPGCTAQAQGFRDELGKIRALGAEVYGVSQDSVESHKKFAAAHKLGFPLIADVKGEISKKYNTDRIFGLSRRWTYIIGPDLRIVSVKKDVDPKSNAKSVVRVLESYSKTKR